MRSAAPTRAEARAALETVRHWQDRAEREQRLAHLPRTRQGVPDLDQLGKPPRTDRRRSPQLEQAGCLRCGSPFAHGCPCADQDRAPGRPRR